MTDYYSLFTDLKVSGGYMNRNLTLEATRLTEISALYASRYMGKGDDELCYRSSDEAMWKLLETMDIEGEVVIGAATRTSTSTTAEKSARVKVSRLMLR